MLLDLALPHLHTTHLGQSLRDQSQKVKSEHLYESLPLIYPKKVFKVFTHTNSVEHVNTFANTFTSKGVLPKI